MGKVDRTAGILKINGTECEMKELKKLIGYVPQEDVMLRELTVLENILHSAKVRLPASWSDKEKTQFAHAVIKILGYPTILSTK